MGQAQLPFAQIVSSMLLSILHFIIMVHLTSSEILRDHL